jgi:cytochrome c biogenesis protein
VSTDLGSDAGSTGADLLGDATPDEQLALTADWGSSRRVRAAGPRLGPLGWLRWTWRQLTSMRTALILLLLLALAAIPGSVLPQRPNDPLAVNDWIERNPGAAPTLDRLGFFDVFASPWFAAIYILLFISLIGCVLPRVGAHWRSMRAPTPPAPRRLDRLAGARAWTTQDPDVLVRAAEVLRADRWRVTPGDDALAAEKGFSRETGNLLFHIALVLVLVGVALGALFGWKGTVIIREGNGFANMLTQYDSFSPGRLAVPDRLPPFSFTMSEFDATFEREGSQRGAPRSFAATLQYVAEPGAPVAERVISVNSPLRLDGAKVFLVGHGYAPHLRVTDSTGRVVFDDTVVFLPQDGAFTSTGVVKAPDGTPQLGLQALFTPTAALSQERGPHSSFPAPDDPALFFSAWTGDLGLDSGEPRNVFSLDTEELEQIGLSALRPGETWQMPGGEGSVEFVGLDRWASFTVSRDPGKVLALVASITAIIGLCLSLFVRRRRIWVRVDPMAPSGATGSLAPFRVQVAGLTRSDSADVSGEVDRLVSRLGGPVEVEEAT